MYGLGPLHAVSLKEARERAKKARLQLQDGEDPIELKRAKRQQATLDAAKTVTFRQAAERFLVAHENEWRNEVHREQWHRTLESYAFPVIGDLPVAAVDLDLVLKVLEPTWHKETTRRLRGRIERVLDWAKVRGLRTGENPARWKGHLDKLLAKPVSTDKHHSRLTVRGCAGVPLLSFEAARGSLPRALEVAILTALRTGES